MAEADREVVKAILWLLGLAIVGLGGKAALREWRGGKRTERIPAPAPHLVQTAEQSSGRLRRLRADIDKLEGLMAAVQDEVAEVKAKAHENRALIDKHREDFFKVEGNLSLALQELRHITDDIRRQDFERLVEKGKA